MEKIPYTKPSITSLEVDFVDDAIRNGWGESCYEYIDRFEAEFGAHVGTAHAIATSSATGALQMGLAAIGVGHGDEVILADSNWIATASPIVHLGAKPVFVDILPDSWCIDPALVEAAITPKTKAIIATHLYGNLCDMDSLLEIGSRLGVPIVEDAAEAVGSVYRGSRAGSMGVFGVFSFHGSKTMTTGEGGMFVTDDSNLADRVLTLSNHGRGRNEERQFWPEAFGYKFKMSNIEAALGCAQISRVRELVARKREILDEYRVGVATFDEISINPVFEHCQSGAWMPNVVFASNSGVKREHLVEGFRRANIDARVFFWPLSSLPLFGAQTPGTVAADIAARSVNLPSFHDIQSREVDAVLAVLFEVLSGSM